MTNQDPDLYAGELIEAAAERFGFRYTLLSPKEDGRKTVLIRISDGEFAGNAYRITIERQEKVPSGVKVVCLD